MIKATAQGRRPTTAKNKPKLKQKQANRELKRTKTAAKARTRITEERSAGETVTPRFCSDDK